MVQRKGKKGSHRFIVRVVNFDLDADRGGLENAADRVSCQRSTIISDNSADVLVPEGECLIAVLPYSC